MQRHAPRRELQLETLERRDLFAAAFRAFDGTGNNLTNPDWGSTDEAFLRLSPAEYADGLAAPAGAGRRSAREVSNLVAAHPDGEILDENGLSGYVYGWGQFLDHDIDLTLSADPAESFPIAVPSGDAYFDPSATGTKTIGLTRSAYSSATGVTSARQQMNSITAFIDGSMVYGTSQTAADSLRTFSGGLMKTSAGNLLPLDDTGTQFQTGDIRAKKTPT